MKILFAFVCAIYVAIGISTVEGVLRGEARPKQVLVERALKSEVKSNDGDDEGGAIEEAGSAVDPDQCRDIPVRVRNDGSQTNFATLYSGIYLWGDTTKITEEKLCESYIAAYTYLTDCSGIPGSYRKVADCSVVKDAAGPTDASLLLELTYFANTVNGAMLYHFEHPDPSCYCDRCPGLAPFPGIYQAEDTGLICTCYCDLFSTNLNNSACTCRSPVISSLVDVLNVAYKDDDFYFLDARQLAIDSTCSNNGEASTFDDTFICPGEQDPSFFHYWTDSPSSVLSVSP